MNKKRTIFGVLLILCLPAIVIGAYIFTARLPREYLSKVTIEVHPPDYIAKLSRSNIPEDVALGFRAAELESIRSEEVIGPVIDELNLADKWMEKGGPMSKRRAHDRLLRMITVKQVDNTDLIEIGVYDTDPAEAANIANTIAVQYRKKRGADMQKEIGRRIAELNVDLTKQREKMEQARAKAAMILERAHLEDPSPNLLNPATYPDSTFPGDYLIAKEQYIREKEAMDMAEGRFETQQTGGPSLLPVKIWEKAEPALAPSWPDVRRVMIGSVVAGVILAGLGALMLAQASREID